MKNATQRIKVFIRKALILLFVFVVSVSVIGGFSIYGYQQWKGNTTSYEVEKVTEIVDSEAARLQELKESEEGQRILEAWAEAKLAQELSQKASGYLKSATEKAEQDWEIFEQEDESLVRASYQ